MDKLVTSIHNPLVKQFYSLRVKSRERRKQNRFGIEGIREVRLALQGGYTLETLLYCRDIISEVDLSEITSNTSNADLVEVSSEVYEKLAYRGSTQGILAIAESKELTLDSLDLPEAAPLILVAEAPEKPGNMGALLRTADAANVDAVLFANPTTDVYNPNTIRSSLGCLFTNEVATGSTMQIIEFLQKRNIQIYCAALQASVPYHTCNFTEPAAIVVGTESDGLSNQWLEHSTQNIVIPMQGAIDSMNVSVAAGILIFEAKRQRNFN